jgi:hypothetical protein
VKGVQSTHTHTHKHTHTHARAYLLRSAVRSKECRAVNALVQKESWTELPIIPESALSTANKLRETDVGSSSVPRQGPWCTVIVVVNMSETVASCRQGVGAEGYTRSAGWAYATTPKKRCY